MSSLEVPPSGILPAFGVIFRTFFCLTFCDNRRLAFAVEREALVSAVDVYDCDAAIPLLRFFGGDQFSTHTPVYVAPLGQGPEARSIL